MNAPLTTPTHSEQIDDLWVQDPKKHELHIRNLNNAVSQIWEEMRRSYLQNLGIPEKDAAFFARAELSDINMYDQALDHTLIKEYRSELTQACSRLVEI